MVFLACAHPQAQRFGIGLENSFSASTGAAAAAVRRRTAGRGTGTRPAEARAPTRRARAAETRPPPAGLHWPRPTWRSSRRVAAPCGIEPSTTGLRPVRPGSSASAPPPPPPTTTTSPSRRPPSDRSFYTWREVTSQSLRSQNDRHFVGITRHSALS